MDTDFSSEDDASPFAFVHRSPIATVVTDPRRTDNPIVAVNEAFTRLTGYSAEEAVGRNCRFLAAGEQDQEGIAALRSAVMAAQPALAELRNYRRDGTRFRNAVMIAPLFGEDGELRYFVGSQMDVAAGEGLPSIARRQQAADLVAGLTPRQRDVLREMMLGYRNKQIASRLQISEKTVKMHRGALIGKLGASTTSDAVRIAVEAGL